MDALLGFDAVRSTYGVSGVGVTIGVISDGIFGLGDAVTSGDLPATTLNRDGGGTLVSTSGGVIAISFRADGDLEGGLGGGTGAEGTAILEIVHDIAPGAQLRFANFQTELEFMAAVDFLAANSDVVIDDIGFFTGHYDQTSPVSTNTADELNKPGNPIRGYYTSVGNQALLHYEGGFIPSVCGSDTCQVFSETADTTDALGIGAQIANPVIVPDGGTVVVFLSWADVFGTTTSDYDLFLFQNDNGQLVAVGGDDNTITGEPTEFLVFTNNTGVSRFYDIFVVNFQGASAPHNLEIFTRGGASFSNGTRLNFNTTRSSVPDQSDSGGGVVSAGAIDAADPGIDDAEDFSSRGPTNNGALKPDVAAIDGVSVTGSGGFPSTFFGTSAAAPHVAGLAGLLLEIAPSLISGEPGDNPAADRDALRNGILNGAVDLGPGGPDNTFGFGRVNGLGAAALLAPPNFIVTNGTDADDGICALDCSLREAINAANANPGMDTVSFNIPGAGPHTIRPTSTLPIITDPVTIDGYTQPGAAPASSTPATLKIELDGSLAGTSTSGLHITAGNSTVRGLAVNRFGSNGILLETNGSNTIEGNYIGTDVTGTVALGNGFNGIAIVAGAQSNTVGGTTTGARNVISGNGDLGIIIVDPGTSQNLVQGNYIGTDVTATAALGNGGFGISILDGALSNTVGGTSAGARNIISGNGDGMEIAEPGTSQNLVQGNYIGTDVTGTVALGNGFNGIVIGAGAQSNTVGGTTAGARNVISGNGDLGIEILDPGTSQNLVQGNYIATTSARGRTVPVLLGMARLAWS